MPRGYRGHRIGSAAAGGQLAVVMPDASLGKGRQAMGGGEGEGSMKK